MLNKRAEQILWHLPNPMLVCNQALQVEYANAAFETMLGISSQTILNRSMDDIGLEGGLGCENLMERIEKITAKELGKYTSDNVKSNKSHHLLIDPLVPQKIFGDYENLQKITLGGKIYSFEIFNVTDSEPMPFFIVVLFKEITKEVKITDQMIQAEKMSGLGTLAAGLAHELNNPLYSIIGLAEMIISENKKGDINSIAKRVIENSKKMVSVVENLTVYSQSSVFKDRELVNLNERLDAALELAFLADHPTGIVVQKNYCSMAFLRAKPEEIEQIFFNIFSNSVQAMKDQGNLKISSHRTDDTNIVVTIEDTGEGIPKEFISRVFDPFFTTRGQGKGTGLGLTATYQLVTKYDGTIKINSVQGEKTTVVICWPVQKENEF